MYNKSIEIENISFIRENEALKDIVKRLRSYIEIKFDMIGVQIGISALSQFGTDKKYSDNEKQLKELCKEEYSQIMQEPPFVKELLKEYEQKKTPIDRMRDCLWEIQHKLGMYGILSFINTHLAMSLEMVFAGLVITYAKAFTSSKEKKKGRTQKETNKENKEEKRTRLDSKIIFKENKKFLQYHDKLMELRNKHFAHSIEDYNRHILSYLFDKGELKLYTNSHCQETFWYKAKYGLFHQVVGQVLKYLEDEIGIRSKQLREKLTKEQMLKLKEMYETG